MRLTAGTSSTSKATTSKPAFCHCSFVYGERTSDHGTNGLSGGVYAGPML